MSETQAPNDAHLMYRVWRRVWGLTLALLFRPKVYGLERIPSGTGVLLCMNHESYLDPFFVATTLKSRTMWVLAMKPLWRSRILGYFLSHHWNGIPVDQEQLSAAVFKQVVRLLRDGKPVLLFPEGQRTMDGKMNRGQPGTGMIVAKARVPVVPIRIFGAHEAWPRGGRLRLRPISLKFGEPIDFAPLLEEAGRDRGVYQVITDRIMDKISQLSLDVS